MKKFVRVIGLFFTLTGVLNFFVTYPFDVHLPTAQAIMHLVVGGAGILVTMHITRYLLSVGIGSVVLGILGFAGVERLLGGVDLTTYFTYLYAVIGIACLLAYQDTRNRKPQVPSAENSTT